MNDLPPSPPRTTSWRKRLIIPAIFFAGGIGITGWLATQTQWGKSLTGQNEPVPAISVDPAQLRQEPTDTAPARTVAELEARLAQVEGREQGGGGQLSGDGTAQSLLLVMAARRAIELGRPLGPLEGELQAQFGSSRPHLITALASAARESFTLKQLHDEFTQVAPRLEGQGANDLWSRFTSGLSSLIVVRNAGEVGTRDDPSVSAARSALDAGHVEEALAIVSRLPGRGQATDWMAHARRHADARRALDALEASIFDAPPAPAPPPLLLPPAPVMDPGPEMDEAPVTPAPKTLTTTPST